VNKNTALTYLRCHVNQLTSLDVSKNTALRYLDCRNNNLQADALNALFESLHDNATSGDKFISIGSNSGTNTCDRSIATAKGWRVGW